MHLPALTLLALAILGYGLVSARAQKSVLTPPMCFVALGFAVGPAGLGWVELRLEAAWIHLLGEVTLLLVLFTDASRIDFATLRRDHDLPVRMLAIGLPLTVVAGVVAGLGLLPALGLWEVAVLAAILAPTDAALGQSVVSSPKLPVRIRQALNVESGVNDGLAVPILLIVLSCAVHAHDAQSASDWLRFTAFQVLLGPLAGVVVGFVGGRFVERASATGWMSHSFQQLSVLGVALAAFAFAEAVGGNGFIAAFAAGLTLGNASRPICGTLAEFGEAEGQLLTLMMFTVFGATMVPEALATAGPAVWAYAAASLTLVRMLPVALSLVGKRLRPSSLLFLGWFGPRGIASVLFLLVVMEEGMLPGGELIFAVGVITVLCSVYAHGLTASPLASAYGASAAAMSDATAEKRAVVEIPPRYRT